MASMSRNHRLAGMTGFTIVWAGQVVSLLGSAMTQFALTIWAWQITGEATALSLVAFFSFGPTVLVSPFAGALVDRWDRKLVMMLSDLAAGLSTIAILTLYATGLLQIWHLYVAGAFAGVFGAFQFPAYSAAVSVMLPKEQYARASGMLSLAESSSGIVAPVLAGILLGTIGIAGIMTIDVVTFVFAIGTLLLVFIPQPEQTEAGREGQGSLWSEALYGFRYILARPSLLGLQLTFFGINLLSTFGWVLLAPLVLARTGNQELVLGSVQSMLGVGGVIGGLVLSLWGGPKRRVHGVLLGMTLSSIPAIIIGVGRGVIPWGLGAFLTMFFVPFINGSNQAIWQAKVAPDVQGRVFSVRRLIAQITAPVAMLIAGPLADRLFEPAMMPEGALAGWFGGLVGTGPGAGMGLLFVLTGVLGAAVGLGGYLFPAIRNAESILPDHHHVAT
jgi:MFS family permease